MAEPAKWDRKIFSAPSEQVQNMQTSAHEGVHNIVYYLR